MSFIQVVLFKSSEYTTDPSTFDSALLGGFGKADGVVARYKGSDLREADTHVYVVVWESQAKFEAFKTGAAPALIAPFKGKIDATLSTISAGDANVNKILSAPGVQITLYSPKAGTSLDDVKPIIQKIVAEETSNPSSEGFARGPVNERPGDFLGIFGWASKEAHDGAVAKHAAEIAELQTKVDVKPHILKLAPYS